MPPPHGVPMAVSRQPGFPSMGTPMADSRQPGFPSMGTPMADSRQPGFPSMDAPYQVSRGEMNQLLKGHQLLLQSAMAQNRDRLMSAVDNTLAMQSQYAAFLNNSSNQQTSPFYRSL